MAAAAGSGGTGSGGNVFRNDEMRYPDDALLAIGATLLWGVFHFVVDRIVLAPIANAFVAEDAPKRTPDSTDRADAPASAKTDKTGGSLRKRTNKGTNEKQSSPATTTAAAAPTKKKKNKLRIRFRTAAWRFLNYAISSTIGVLCLYDKDWVWQPREYFVNWPHFPLEESTRFYYAVGFGSYAYGFISLLFFEPWQSDFLAMIIHHFSTLTVIIASFLFKQTRVGVVVLLLHDVSDPFMEIAKCFLYLKWQKLADATFLLFAAVFMFTRNYIFPVYVITAPFLYQTRGDGPDDIPLAIFWLCVGCLIVLALLHVYWAFLLIKMIIRAIRAKSVEGDVRDVESDDE